MTLPPALLELLRVALRGDPYSHLLYGLGAVLVVALFVFAVAAAGRAR